MIPSVQRPRDRGTWPAAAGLTLALAAAGGLLWWLLPVAPLPLPGRTPTPPFISIQKPGGAADMTMDQALLFDSAPLFLPTRWSTTLSGSRVGRPGGDDPFALFASEISATPASLRPPAIPVGDAVPALLPDRGGMDEFSAMGRDDPSAKVGALPPRGAAWEVRRADNGNLVLSGRVKSAIPEAGDLLWQPAEFWLMVNQAGPVGAPLVASGTGSDSLDAALRSLIQSSEPVNLLPPGYYRIVVGP